jgi:hypothetical protein
VDTASLEALPMMYEFKEWLYSITLFDIFMFFGALIILVVAFALVMPKR